MTTRSLTRVAVCIGAAGVAGSAGADLSNEIFTVTATAGGMSATWTTTADNGWWKGDTYYWDLTEPVELRDDATNTLIATVASASMVYVADPIVELNFNMQAGSTATGFNVSSGLLSFPTLNNPDGAASAGITITDVNGDGANLTPASNGAYLAQYNGAVPTGTDFAQLIQNPFSAGAFSSHTENESHPAAGFVNIGGAISDMSSQFNFTLSAFDIVSSTSTYVITPAPSSLALLGMSGLLISRRRR